MKYTNEAVDEIEKAASSLREARTRLRRIEDFTNRPKAAEGIRDSLRLSIELGSLTDEGKAFTSAAYEFVRDNTPQMIAAVTAEARKKAKDADAYLQHQVSRFNPQK